MMPKICAHRGASHIRPENTLAAFRLALEQKADSIEVDVRQTADGHLVACHDFNLSRLTGRPLRLSEITLEEFQSLRINQREPPATLDEVFRQIRTSAEIILDVKESNLEKKILRLVDAYDLREQVIISSFDPRILAATRKLNQKIRTALIAGPLSILPLAVNICFYLRKVSEYTKSDYMHLHYMDLLHPGYQTLARWGYRISYWTINHPRNLRNVLTLNPEAIITNRPDLARAILQSSQS